MITVKEEFLTEDKTRQAIKKGGYEAIVMWLAIKGYVARKNSNGFVPDEAIDELPGAPRHPRKALQALVDCGLRREDGTVGSGLVDKVQFGWSLHDYEDHGTIKEVEDERRRKAREQKAARRAQLAAAALLRTSAGQSADRVPDSPRTEHRTNTPDIPPDIPPDTPRPPARTSGHGRVPQPSPAQPKEKQQEKVVVDPRVPCPPDLQLAPAQRSTLEGSFMPGWAIDILTTNFAARYTADSSDRRTLEHWRKCLSMAICSDWNNSAKRPKKPEPDDSGEAIGWP